MLAASGFEIEIARFIDGSLTVPMWVMAAIVVLCFFSR